MPDSLETRKTCTATVWDGPYRMTCGLLIVNGRCRVHGERTNHISGDASDRIAALEAQVAADGRLIAMLRATRRDLLDTYDGGTDD